MCSELHGSVFCQLPARQLLPMGALSPRRRRCSAALQRDSRVLAAMFFYGLIQWLAVQSDPRPAPLFAHFFWQDRKSGSAKQQPRCHRDNGSSGEYGQKGGQAPALFLFVTSGVGRPRAFGSETAKYQWTMLCRCAIIFAKINHKHSLIQRYRKEDQYGGNQGELRR